MSDGEFKAYDTDDQWSGWAMRLAKDAEVKEGNYGKLVRITFVSSSKAEGDDEAWIEGTVNDNQADLAAALKKGDVIPGIEGKLTFKTGSNGKMFLNLRRTRLHLGAALLKELRARGGGSGASSSKAKPAGRVAAKPVAKPAGRARKIVEIPDDDEE